MNLHATKLQLFHLFDQAFPARGKTDSVIFHLIFQYGHQFIFKLGINKHMLVNDLHGVNLYSQGVKFRYQVREAEIDEQALVLFRYVMAA